MVDGFKEIQIGERYEGEVEEGQLALYKFELEDAGKMITVIVEPLNEQSDPDLYVKVNDMEVS